MSIIRRIPWTRQPGREVGLNRSSPFYQGLIYAKNMVDIYSPDLVQNAIPSIIDFTQDSGAGAASTGGPVRYLNTTGASADYFDTNYDAEPHVANNNKISGLVILRGTESAGTIVAQRTNANTAWQLYTSGGRAIFRVGGTTETIDSGSGSINSGNWIVVGFSADLGTQVELFKNGVSETGSPVSHIGTCTTDVINLSVGQRWGAYPATGYPGDWDVALVLLWNRYLSDAEQYALGRNPWQVFEPRHQFFGVEVGAAPVANPVGRLTLLGVGR